MPQATNDTETSNREPVLVDFALQGGGSHGAFTWGALDRLLEEPWLRVEAISGTSAGAMNAAVLADGFAHGGAEGALCRAGALLAARVATPRRFSPLRRSPLDVLLGRWTLDHSPVFVAMDLMSRLFSPYDLESGGPNPLRDILAECVDFRATHRRRRSSCSSPRRMSTPAEAVCSATTKSPPDVLLASACLPTMFQAVEIEGEPYWDGGYSGNPTITPAGARHAIRDDTILIQINPVERPGVPRTARDILNRLNEISFNAAAAQGTAA